MRGTAGVHTGTRRAFLDILKYKGEMVSWAFPFLLTGDAGHRADAADADVFVKNDSPPLFPQGSHPYVRKAPVRRSRARTQTALTRIRAEKSAKALALPVISLNIH